MISSFLRGGSNLSSAVKLLTALVGTHAAVGAAVSAELPRPLPRVRTWVGIRETTMSQLRISPAKLNQHPEFHRRFPGRVKAAAIERK